MTGIKGKSGGSRGGGAKKKPEGEKKKMRSAYLTDNRYNKIIAKYGSITKALESMRIK
jgi:hypothetical protein